MPYRKLNFKAAYPYFILGIIVLSFFYKTILFGKLPFPGDLLLTQYGPWRHESYDGYVAGAIPSKDQYFDVVRELYPWKTLVISQLKSGHMPLWNPYNFSGAPLMANFQSQVLYPLTVMYMLIPQDIAWTALIILQPLLGSAFMYMFASEIGLGAVAAMTAALLFNFSSFATVWMEFTTVWHTILWLPLLLYLIERTARQKNIRAHQALLFIFALFSAITGGHPQDFINMFLFMLLYAVARVFTAPGWKLSEKIRFLAFPVLSISTLPFLLAMPQLLLTAELFRNSARVAHDYSGIIGTMLVQWWQLPMLLVQDFFGNPATRSSVTGDYVGKTLSIGIAGFVLALTAVFSRNKSWHVRFCILMSLLVLGMTVRNPISELLYRYPLPVLSTGTPTRILFLFAFTLSVLAGFGVESLRHSFRHIRMSLVSTWIFLSLLWVFAVLHPEFIRSGLNSTAFDTMKRALIVSSSILIALSVVIAASRYRFSARPLILLVCAVELFYGFIKFNPFVPRSFIFPDNTLITYLQNNTGIDRFWGYGTAETEANFATQEHVFSADGTDPLNLSWYNQFIQSSADGNLARRFTRTTRSDAKIASGYGETDLPQNKYRLKIMDLLSVRYIIDRSENPKNDQTFPSDRFTPVWHEKDWTVYRNNFASPRVVITGDIRYYSTPEEFEQAFFSDSFDVKQTVLMEKNVQKFLSNVYPATGSARITRYSANEITVRSLSDSPQVIFLADTYDPNWKATVDSHTVPVLKANYAFRAVPVPAGTHEIRLSYVPDLLRIGMYLSVTGGIITATVIWILIRSNRKKAGK